MKTARIPWQHTFTMHVALMFLAVGCGYDRFSSCETPEDCEQVTGAGGVGGAGGGTSGSAGAEPTSDSGGAGGSAGSAGPGGSGGSGGANSESVTSSGGSSGAAGAGNPVTCPEGFERDEEGECIDIDECEVDHGGCHPSAECRDSDVPAEAPSCECPEGLTGDGFECELTVIDFAVGGGQACAIRSDRSLWCWGSNSSGQLGPDELGDVVPWPTPIAEGTRWDSISIGTFHTCGISDGAMYCWGTGTSGALGLGDQSDRSEPARVGDDDDWQHVDAGTLATCGIRSDGELYCWGIIAGAESQADYVSEPVKVERGGPWSDIALAREHRCGLVEGHLLCYGTNSGNSLGLDMDRVLEPTLVSGADGWTMLSARGYYTCGIRNKRLYCWGSNGPTSDAIGPEQVGNESDWETISVGESEGCGIRSGELMCWGDNARGLRGGDKPDTFQVAPTGFGSGWEKVGVGSGFACALKAGQLYCWGDNSTGRLGVGDSFPSSIATPQRVGDASSWSAVSVGSDVSCGLRAGEAYCWGAQRARSLQYGAFPTRVSGKKTWTNISAGRSTIAGVAASELFWWGYAPGVRTADAVLTPDPVPIGAGSTWSYVGTSWAFEGPTCAIDADGRLYCLGANNLDGQLGLGHLDPTAELTPVGTSSGWQRVAPGVRHACGIDGGKLFCWGDNDYGQLGLGDELVGEDQPSPVQVGSDDTWSDVAVSGTVTCGISEGALYCWGLETSARPALDVAGNASSPQQVGDLFDWQQLDLNDRHGCAVRDDGGLYCWGDNTRALLGVDSDGDPELISEPTPVSPGSSWALVSTGASHSCGLQTDGSVWCWGSNASGELGVGPAWSTTPVPITFD